jgi:hypothetical protein
MHHNLLARWWQAAVLAAAALAVVLAAGEDLQFDRSRCPSWLHDYEQFHKENRGRELANYLVANAGSKIGVGDMLRGMMFALRVAAATKRVLLLNWNNNAAANLTTFLVPASGINWTLPGTLFERFSETDFETSTAQTDVMPTSIISQNIKKLGLKFSQKQFLVFESNLRAEQHCSFCPDGGSRSALDDQHTCMFQFLFKPSELVHKMAAQQLAALFPGQPLASLGYQAVHLRLGNQVGEARLFNRIGYNVESVDSMLLSVSCGLGMAQQSGINTSAMPLLLIADHRNVRRFSQRGMIKHVVTPNYAAVHTGRSNNSSSYLFAFVDIYLLARAKCLLLSHSGFSNVAWWLSGGISCTQTLRECYLACRQQPPQPYCLT